MVVFSNGAGSGGGGGSSTSGVNPSVTTWAQLAAIATAALSKPQVIVWVEAVTFAQHTTQLRAGTDATDTASGIQRPNDYNGATNAYVWYDA